MQMILHRIQFQIDHTMVCDTKIYVITSHKHISQRQVIILSVKVCIIHKSRTSALHISGAVPVRNVSHMIRRLLLLVAS